MWKKKIYKRVFDRLHSEQWNNKNVRKSSTDGNAGSRSRDNSFANTASPKRRRREDDADNNSDSDSGSGGEEVFDDAYVQREMGDMIHRAAQWLTALDGAGGRSSRGRGRGGRGHSGRPLPTSTSGRGSGLPKRARLS